MIRLTDRNPYKIKYTRLLDYLFAFFIFCSVISEHTIIGNCAYVLFVGMSFLYSILIQKIKFNLYFGLEIIFILYCLYQNISGISVNVSVAQSHLSTIILCFTFDLAIYIYIVYKKNIMKVLSIFVASSFCGLLVTMLCDYNLILAGRFGNNTDGLSIFGTKIGGLNSTAIGYIAGIALYISVFLYWKTDIVRYYFYLLFFSFVIIVSGTRKMIIMIPIALLCIAYFKYTKQKFKKLIIRSTLVFIVCLIGFYCIMNVSLLYNALGYRIENVLNYLKEGITEEGSLNSRNRLVELARNSFKIKPITGWGLNNFKYTLNNGGYYAHNNYWEILVSGGVIGFIIYYSKYIYLLYLLIKKKYSHNKKYNYIINSFILLIITLSILEYWQVTYFFRLYMLPFIFTLGYLHSEEYKMVGENDIIILEDK